MQLVPKRLPLALALFASILAVRTTATTVVPLTFDELVAGAGEIFVGQVVGVHSQFVNAPEGRAIVTVVTFRVDESLKGGLQTQTSLEFLGGEVGDMRMVVAGVPQFHVGDRDVVFVGSRNDVSPVEGVMQGRFRIVRDPERGVDTVRSFDGRPLATVADIGKARTQSIASHVTMALSDFRAAVSSRVVAGGGR